MIGGADDDEDIVVAVQGAETAGLDPYLGGPAADVLAACDATDKAGGITPVAMRPVTSHGACCCSGWA